MIDTDTIAKLYTMARELQMNSSRNRKIEILKQYKIYQDFRDWLDAVYNPYKVYGIQLKKLSKFIGKPHNNDVELHNLQEVFQYLSNHSTGSDENVDTVAAYIDKEFPLEGVYKDFVIKSITKSIKIGCTPKTINKAFEENFIPEFNVQLAKKYVEEQSKIDPSETLYVSTKLDGIRCIAVNRENKVTFFTRQGQPIFGLNEIAEEIRKLPHHIVLDGELLLNNDKNLSSADLYRETMKVVRSDSEKHNVIYNVFDIAGTNEWDSNNFKGNYEERRYDLDRLFNYTSELKYIKKVELLYKGNNKQYISDLLDKVISEGKEGLMVNRNFPYTKTRTNHLLKLKKFQSADVKIQKLIEGQGKYKGMLGAAVINFPCSDGTFNSVEVGSGWSDELRKEVWNNKKRYLKDQPIIEIGYFEISKNSKTGKESLRFPTFKRLRSDKTEESWY